MKKIFLSILVLIFSFQFKALSQNNKRLALVIGISNYQNTIKLENPVNDARLIAASLKEVNFDVILREDINRKELLESIKTFANKLIDSNFEAGVFYYAGHALQVDNSNYLVPIDAEINNNYDLQDVQDNCVNIQRLMSFFTSERLSNKVLITILDACRSNPFLKNRSVGEEGGLLKMNAVSGSLIAYSTEPGKVASDGIGKVNSIYSEVLSKNIKTPNLSIEDLFKIVRTEVEYQSKYKQSPREESALKGSTFYFNKKINYNKIDIQEIESEMYNLIIKKNYNKALEMGATLKNIYKDRNDSLSYLYYIKLLFNIAEINFIKSNDSLISNIESEYHLVNSSIALNEVLGLLKKNIFVENIQNSFYSKALINFLYIETRISPNKRVTKNNDLISFGQELVRLNENYFGLDDYKTVCSYYILGHIKSIDSFHFQSYNLFNKVYEYFEKSDFRNKPEYKNYFFNFDNLPYKAIYWSLWASNSLIIYHMDFPERKLIDSFSIKSNLFFNKFNSQIKKNIPFIQKNNLQEINNYLFQCRLFYDNFSFIINKEDSFLNRQCELELTDIDDKMLFNARGYFDSIIIFRDKAVRLNNSIKSIISLKVTAIDSIKISTLEDLLLKSISLSYRNNDNLGILESTAAYLRYYKLYNGLISNFFKKVDIIEILNKYNEKYSEIITDYKLSQKRDIWDPQFDDLFVMFYDLNSIDLNYKLAQTNQYIEYVVNSKNYGFGSPRYLIALQLKAVLLGKSINKDDIVQAKNEMISLIKLNNQFSKKWSKKDIDGCFDGSRNKEDCIANLLSDVYYNYAIDILMSDDEIDLNNPKDSFLINSFENFNLKYKENLLFLNKYYFSNIPSLQLNVLYNKKNNPSLSLSYCNMALVILEERLKMDSLKSENDHLNNYYAEYNKLWFFKKKLEILQDNKQQEYVETKYKEIDDISNFDKSLKVELSLKYYSSICDFYFFKSKDFIKAKEIAKEGYEKYKNYLNNPAFIKCNKDNFYKVEILQLLNNLLSRSVEPACSPNNLERNTCIDASKRTIEFIYNSWDSSFIIKNIFLNKVLEEELYRIADISYFMQNYNEAIKYYKKRQAILYLFTKNEDNDFEISNNLKLISINYLAIKDTINATNSYIESVNSTFSLDTSMDRNIQLNIESKTFGLYTIPFLHLTINSAENSWPCIEFDVNDNLMIDSLIDKRYFLDTLNNLKVEFIKTLTTDIGGFKFSGEHLSFSRDTSTNIFFENGKPLKTSAYYFKTLCKINDSLKFGKLQIGSNLNKWDFYIPISEITDSKTNYISFILSNISKEKSNGIESRVFNKNTLPSKAHFTLFKDSIKLKL